MFFIYIIYTFIKFLKLIDIADVMDMVVILGKIRNTWFKVLVLLTTLNHDEIQYLNQFNRIRACECKQKRE